jgi:uncharacterized protein YwqG
MLGVAVPIQGPVEAEMDYWLGEDHFAMDGPWRVLMQIDSDNAANMMWGDAGTLYFMAREEWLRRFEWDRVWCVMQCS